MWGFPKPRPIPILTALAVAVSIIALRGTGTMQLLEWAALDQFWRWRPAEPPENRIVIVAIDEGYIKNTAEWPVSDGNLARVIEKILVQKPTVIGLDLYRDLPVGKGNAELVKLFANTPNLFGITKATGNTKENQVPPPTKLAEAGRVGFNDVLIDGDGKIRRALLALPDEPSQSVVRSLPVVLALAYLRSHHPDVPSMGNDNGTFQLGKAEFAPLPPYFGSYIDINDAGFQVLLNYRSKSCRGSNGCQVFPTVSISDLLADRVDKNLMRDRLVLIGSTAESVKDRFFTPFSSGDSSSSPGVEIHADITSQLLGSALENRAVIQDLPDPLEWLWILVWSGVGACLGMVVISRQRLAIGLFLLAHTALVGGLYLAFWGGWWIPLVPPLLAMATSTGLTAIAILVRNLQHSNKALAVYTHTLEQQVCDRTQALSLKNSQLETEICDRQAAEQLLTQINAELQSTLTNLQVTQAQLVESEKMAALGNLVAGVAHEINTPIGNSILAASTLVNEVQYFQAALSNAPLKRSLLEDYLAVTRESSEIILVNLRRAGELVNSFKQVAVDRTSEGLRQFIVKPYIQDVLLSLEPKLKQTRHRIKIEGSNRLAMHSYPGAFSQVITNLVLNSLLHAYRGDQQGNLMFELVEDEQYLTLHYQDDGCGIAPEHLDQIFTPFFTTARDRGGSGLGLHITYNLVTQKLKGTIQVQSQLNYGSRFTLHLPLHLEAQDLQNPEVEPDSVIAGIPS